MNAIIKYESTHYSTWCMNVCTWLYVCLINIFVRWNARAVWLAGRFVWRLSADATKWHLLILLPQCFAGPKTRRPASNGRSIFWPVGHPNRQRNIWFVCRRRYAGQCMVDTTIFSLCPHGRDASIVFGMKTISSAWWRCMLDDACWMISRVTRLLMILLLLMYDEWF